MGGVDAALAVQPGGHEPYEQRVGARRPRLELGMRLRGHVVGVELAIQLDELCQVPVRRGARDMKPRGLQAMPVGVVHLEAVAVALRDLAGAVELRHERPLGQHGWVGAEPHRPAQVAAPGDELALRVHRRDHRVRRLRLHLRRRGPLQAQQVARGLDDHALQPQAQPEHGDPVLPGPAQRPELALDPAHAEAARHHDGVDPGQRPLRPLRRLAGIGGDPADIHPRVTGEAPVADRLGDGQVGVMEVDVLADQRHLQAAGGVVDPLEQPVPLRPVNVAEGQAQALDEEGVQALAVQCGRDLVDAGGVRALDDGLAVHVAHERHLALDALGQGAVRAQDERVGRDADRAQGRHRVLRRLGLELVGRRQEGDERHMHEGDVLPAQVGAHLPRRLEEGLGLDVAHGPADLRDDDIRRVPLRVRLRLGAHDPLDLIGDMGDDLDGVAQVLSAALLGDDAGVDLARGRVRGAGQTDVEEALVVADVEIRLSPILSDEDLAVLEGVHRPGIDVDIRVELLHRHADAPRPQEPAEARRRQALPERGDDSARNEDVGRTGGLIRTGARAAAHHGTPAYDGAAPPPRRGRRPGHSRRWGL